MLEVDDDSDWLTADNLDDEDDSTRCTPTALEKPVLLLSNLFHFHSISVWLFLKHPISLFDCSLNLLKPCFRFIVCETCLTALKTCLTSNAIAGETSLDRLANALGGKVILPHIIRNITSMLQSGLCV